MSELIPPIAIMVTLFVVNAIVVFIIYRYRQREAAKSVCTEEELTTFSTNIMNANEYSALSCHVQGESFNAKS
ncbi:hypothetical protein Trydic_g7198 [Trypoxylus dichotomus]